MSLATRCTTCGTVFRVVQDQLKVSEGWVRCGRCSEVFNALEGLFDLERDTPPEWPVDAPAPPEPPAPPAQPTPPEPTAMPAPDTAPEIAPEIAPETAPEIAPDSGSAPLSADAPPSLAADDASSDAIDKIDAQLMGARESEEGSTPATRINERDRLEFPDAQFGPDMLAEDTVALRAPATALSVAEQAHGATARPVVPSAEPDFLQHAERRARWSSPRMRALQAAGVVALLLVLGLQGLHQFRDEAAARWPEAGPLLASWCNAVGCTIAAPQRIEDVAVESTALTRASAPDAFQLSVVLRNRGVTTVAMPSVDLSLTDASGQLVSRRMLAPSDFRVAAAPMRPGAESSLQLFLSTGGARVTGYTVEVFYP